MNLMIVQLVSGILFLIISLFFGILPLKIPTFRTNPKLLSYSNCFAAGLFLAIGIIHILPEAVESFEEKKDVQHGDAEPFPWAYLITICSFSTILLIDKVVFNSADQIEDQSHIDLSHSILNKGPGTLEENYSEMVSTQKKLGLRLSMIRMKQKECEEEEDILKE